MLIIFLMTTPFFSIIIAVMKILDLIYKYILSPIHIIVSLIITVADILILRYLRLFLDASYKKVNFLAIGLLALSALNAAILYKDTVPNLKKQYLGLIPIIIYFAGYIVTKVILKG